VSEFVVRSPEGLYLQLDGEPVSFPDTTEYRFRCLPSAASVLIKR
jgi:diacylglycerol kinase family enzyme